MNEPKKRGRPSNAELLARSREHVATAAAFLDGSTNLAAAQAYALRVWNGQSPTADRPWRIERVKQALEAQGLSMEGVELP